MQVTVTEAPTEPVFVKKDDHIKPAILSVQQFETFEAADSSKTLNAWLEEQTTRFEKNGLWCDDLRVW